MNVSDVRRAYDELSNQRRVITEQEKDEMDRRVTARMLPYEREFSTLMHASHQAGVSKADLRVASRQGRNPGFSYLWNLVSDNVRPTDSDRYVWVDDTTLDVYTSGIVITATDVEWFVEATEGGGERKTATFTLAEEDQEFYPQVYKQAEKALSDKETEND